MGKKFIYSILLFLITFTLKAEGYRISIKWQGLQDSTIYLARYYDTTIYKRDSLKLDKKGEGILKGDSALNEGLYLLYMNGNTYFDFLVGSDQNLKIETNNSDLLEHLSIKGSIESEQFMEYQKYVKQKSIIKRELIEKLKNENPDTSKIARDELEQLDKEMETYVSEAITNAGNNMLGLFLNAANTIRIPEPDIEKTHPKYDSIAWFHAYNYRRDHFLESIDFTDERILNTPSLIKPKLEIYFNKILIQSPDSIIPQAVKLLRMAESNIKTYQYLTQFFINNSVQSKIMGMDAVFVAIADEVYLQGKATWADSTVLAKIAEEAYLTRPNLIGKTAPELVMENIDGEFESLHQLQCKYTILIFYEYDCGHCKKDIPALYNDVYLKFSEDNVEVFAVCMNDDRKKWEEFVEKNKLDGWHHTWDPLHKSKYRFKYNTKTVPTLLLLDKDKKIIAKKIDNSTLTSFLNTLLKKK